MPKRPFYLTGQAGGRTFSVFAEGETIYLRREDGTREEVDLDAARPTADLPAEALRQVEDGYRAWRIAQRSDGERAELPEPLAAQGAARGAG